VTCYNDLKLSNGFQGDRLIAERVRDYEAVLVLSPEATEDEIAATIQKIEEVISEHGGDVVEKEIWGLKKLAYKINGFTEGNYVLVKFSLNAGGVAELNTSLNMSEDVIRFLVSRI